MKKTIALVLVLCLTLCACSGTRKFTVNEVISAFTNSEGTLNLETAGNYVVGFTYTLEGINPEVLADRTYVRDTIDTVMAGNVFNLDPDQVNVCHVVLALLNVEILLSGDGEEVDQDAFVERALGILCDGQVEDYNGWSVSAAVDVAGGIITVYCEQLAGKG